MISVIIPIYNVEKYLKQCLDSVVNQTYKDLEIICVEDCGQDNSIEIVKEYINKDSRIKLIRHSSNKGVGPARNTGLDNANGDYIFFLDSDDYLKENAIENLYNKINETDYDFVVTRTEAFAEDDSPETIERTQNMNNWLDKKELDNYQVDINNYIQTLHEFNCIAIGKLFKKDFIINNNLRFIDEQIVHEDIGFWIKILANFPKISYIKDVGIMYRIRKYSITADIYKKENENKEVKHMQCILKDAFDYLKNNCPCNISKQLIKEIKNSLDYFIYFDIRTWYLKYRWCKNNKRITFLGLPLFREKVIDDKHKIGKVIGIPIYKKKLNKKT